MLATLVFIIIFGILITVHEFGHFIAAKRSGVRVDRFSIGFGPKLCSVRRNGTEYVISALPFGGYVKLGGDNYQEFRSAPDEYLSQPVHKRFWIIFSGPLVNYLIGFLFFWVIFCFGYPTLTNKVGEVMDGYGAKSAGIAAGDRIVSIEGKSVKTWEDIQRALQSNRGKPQLSVTVLRDGAARNFQISLLPVSRPDALGQKRSSGIMGVKPDMKETVKVRYGPVEAAYHGFKRTVDLTVLTYKAFWFMISGKLSFKDSVTGPVGMFMITSEIAKLGIIALLNWTALLSVSLGIFNLIPFPALDGGHILLLGLEKIRGKKLGPKAEDTLNQVGFGFIILLAVAVFYNDLSRYGFFNKVFHLFGK